MQPIRQSSFFDSNDGEATKIGATLELYMIIIYKDSMQSKKNNLSTII